MGDLKIIINSFIFKLEKKIAHLKAKNLHQ